ncbi:MAG: hypothetical protein A2138_19660, partial [Deltaproteobacteria bacterium RBG_16_71_12]
DDDGTNDGTEDRDRDGAVDAPNPTGVQETDPRVADTDGDGLCDGPASAGGCTAGEDLNRNGRIDAGETDPRVPDVDTDGDGLSDPQEALIGTNPNAADTDGDGVADGLEVQRGTDPLSVDTDCDGLNDGQEAALQTSPVDRDSDDDGITDGVESGTICTAGSQTAQSCIDAGLCQADADPGSTTDPRNADTDGDQVPDGAEDGNQDGYYDAAAGELNPNVDDVGQAEVDACGLENLREVTLVQRPDDTADLILAVPQEFPVGRITELRNGAGEQIGAMVFDPVDQVAGVAMKLALAGGDPTAEINDLRATLDGAVGSVAAFSSQTFTSWDAGSANNAAIGRAEWTDANGGDTVAKSMNDIVQALVAGATGLLDTSGSTESGSMRMQIEVLDRSASSTVVVIAMTQLAASNGDETRLFSIDNLANGTAVAQFGDDTGVQCDRFQVEARQEVDFLLVVDNSGSMDNEQTAVANAADALTAQLGASTVDFRIAVVTTDLDEAPNNSATWTACTLGDPGGCNQTGDGAKIYCPFTTSSATLRSCIDQMNTNGSGEENGLRPVACLMGRTVTGPGINQDLSGSGERGGAADGEPCGRDGDRAPYPAGNTYAAAPAGFAMLPRADGSATRIRTGAQLAVIFITDANEQSDGRYTAGTVTEAVATHSIPSWSGFLQNFDGGGDATLSRALVHGIVCPAGAGCTDEGGNYENTRYRTLLAALGGVEADIRGSAQQIADGVALMLQQTVAQASPYALQKPPISSTIKVAGEFEVENTAQCSATCTAAGCSDIPRSRVNGFDYDGTTNSVSFFGACRPKSTEVGVPFAVSYKYWIEDSPNPDGNNAQCTPPLVLAPNGTDCICPSDCGVAGGLSPGQTCNATTCEPECLPDCGGCGSGQVCNTGSPTCACECPADCNTGAPLPPSQVCDPATCTPVCAPGGCTGSPPNGNPGWFCGADCEWECAADCGDPTMSATERCNQTTCQVECASDCNATCSGYTECNSDPAICACECVESATCAPGYTFNPDEAVCDCACD